MKFLTKQKRQPSWEYLEKIQDQDLESRHLEWTTDTPISDTKYEFGENNVSKSS